MKFMKEMKTSKKIYETNGTDENLKKKIYETNENLKENLWNLWNKWKLKRKFMKFMKQMKI